MRLDQRQTPLFDALKKHIADQVTPFHVPGHKHGVGASELESFLGENLMKIDLNAMGDIDDICNPTSCIQQSELLLADAFGADSAFMLTNGTTSGIHAMMLATLKPGDKVIIPRNVHKSVISGLILTGAIPVYVHAEASKQVGISTTVTPKAIEDAFKKEPQAVGVFVINSSYYGFAADIRQIVQIANAHGALVFADEAHGCHFDFHPDLPISGMAAGADFAASSMHKTAGSLTQSSILLMKNRHVSPELVKQALNLIRSTSGSYPLMLSLELARKQMALEGKKRLSTLIDLSNVAREEINKIDGLYCFAGELLTEGHGHAAFDPTKLNIYVRGLGLTGFEIEAILREKYAIQIELSELNTIMAILTIGDTEQSITNFVEALKAIAKNATRVKETAVFERPDVPQLIVTPREAFYQHKRSVKLNDALGEISGEMIMAYPPGIPIICPGERIGKDVIDYIKLLKAQHCTLQGNSDPHINSILVLGA
jgi:arginine decarboxylase